MWLWISITQLCPAGWFCWPAFSESIGFCLQVFCSLMWWTGWPDGTRQESCSRRAAWSAWKGWWRSCSTAVSYTHLDVYKRQGYAYIGKERNKFTGLYYVSEDHIGIIKNTDPIYKDYQIMVNGASYRPYQFLKILRNTRDGCQGVSLLEENQTILNVGYNLSLIHS